MTKKLTPLEALCYLDDIAHGRKTEFDPHQLKIIIETALKRLEFYDKCNYQTTIHKDVLQISKELQALEIVKEKVMCLVSLDDGEICKGHYRVYDGELFMHTELTKEEFDILKEVLK